MQIRKSVFAMLFALLIATPSSGNAQSELVNGEVTKIDQAASKITIRHEPLKKLDMEAMNMVFRVQDPEMLKKVKVGDKIKFDADRINGQITVTTIQPAK